MSEKQGIGRKQFVKRFINKISDFILHFDLANSQYRLFLFAIIPTTFLASYIVIALFFPNISKTLGGISNILSFLIALLTYFYVLLTGSMIHHMRSIHIDEYRAYIVADIEFRDKKALFTLRNIGKTAAKNIYVKVSPEIIAGETLKFSEAYFSKPIGYFPPSRYYETEIHNSSTFLKLGNPREYTIELTYELTNTNKTTTESYEITLEYLANRMTIV